MENTIKIAVPVTIDNNIDDHFGHCEFYSVYTISTTNEILNVKTIKSEQGCGCKSNIANTLATDGVTIMLAGGIGEGAINVLKNSGIEVVRGCSGDVNNLINRFTSGFVMDSGSSCAQHEQHNSDGHKHECNH